MFNTFFGANLCSTRRISECRIAVQHDAAQYFVSFGLDWGLARIPTCSLKTMNLSAMINTLEFLHRHSLYIRYQIINLHHFTYFEHFYISIHHILCTINTRAIHNTRTRASIYLLWRSKPPLRHLPEEFGDVDRLVNAMSFEQPDGNPGKLDIRAIVTTYAPPTSSFSIPFNI